MNGKFKTAARILALALALALAVAAFAGCGGKKKDKGGKTSGTSSETQSETGGDSSEAGNGAASGGGTASNGGAAGNTGKTSSAPKKTAQLTFWSYYGNGGAANVGMKNLAKKFNSSQSAYKISITYKGGAGDIRTALMSAKKSNRPSGFNGEPINNAQYAQADYCVPVSKFIKDDPDGDWTKQWFATTRLSYSDRQGNVVGVPIGVSITGFTVNLDALKAVTGSSDVKQITSFKKMAEIAKKYKEANPNNYGISFNTGAELHDMLIMDGYDIVNNGNGWSGTPTKSLLTSGDTGKAARELTGILCDLFKTKAAFPRDATGNMGTLFYQGKVLFAGCTNSALQSWIVDVGKPGFDWAFLPTPPYSGVKYKNMALSEGTGMYICDTGDENEMRGMYEYMKFCSKAENQTLFCSGITYVPYTKEAVTSKAYVDNMNKTCPQVKSVIDILQSSSTDLKGTYASVGNALKGCFTDLFLSCSTDPDGNADTFLADTNNTLQMAIDTFVRRQKK